MTNKKTKAEVMDLLNQIVVLTKGIKAVDTGEEDYDTGRNISISDVLSNFEYLDEEDKDDDSMYQKYGKLSEEEKQELLDQDYLANVSAICKRVADGDAEAASYNEQQYYNSNCY